MKVLPLLLKDGYKVGHKFQYPDGTTLVYSNLTPRKARNEAVNEIIFFGLQYFVKEYLIEQFNDNFFKADKKTVIENIKEG
jgi:nicotinamide phosphoribosyltransferase